MTLYLEVGPYLVYRRMETVATARSYEWRILYGPGPGPTVAARRGGYGSIAAAEAAARRWFNRSEWAGRASLVNYPVTAR